MLTDPARDPHHHNKNVLKFSFSSLFSSEVSPANASCYKLSGPTSLALASWARVVRPGGHIINFMPDACAGGMDVVRLAMPPMHYLDEYRRGSATSHESEQILSVNRFMRMTSGPMSS
mgnify:CR=1 FL=1